MTDVSNRIQFCYAWEDLARVQQIVAEMEHELEARVSSGLSTDNPTHLNESTASKITETDFFIVFISEAAKRSDYVRQCVALATNLNKNILPVEISKQGIFSAKAPEEFKFRSEPYNYSNPKSKAAFYAQLKAALGLNMEGGDAFGALVHIVTDRKVKIKRYGKVIGFAEPNSDCQVRLVKGEHQLQIEDAHNPDSFVYQTVTVSNYDSERFVNIQMDQLLAEKKYRKKMLKWGYLLVLPLIIGIAGLIFYFLFYVPLRSEEQAPDPTIEEPAASETPIDITAPAGTPYRPETPTATPAEPSAPIEKTPEAPQQTPYFPTEKPSEPSSPQTPTAQPTAHRNDEIDVNKIYSAVEVQAEFPGGDHARRQWLRDNIQWPLDANGNQLRGEVELDFVIERDGSISNVKVTYSENPALNSAAINLIRSMPRWSPAKVNNQPVRSPMGITLFF